MPRSFRKYNFPIPSMNRGVQLGLERKQRPSRLAFIHESQRQANEIRRFTRERQLEDREARVTI